ncbi:hypothetical protein OROGR_028270 [Orobanche gracilis]
MASASENPDFRIASGVRRVSLFHLQLWSSRRGCRIWDWVSLFRRAIASSPVLCEVGPTSDGIRAHLSGPKSDGFQATLVPLIGQIAIDTVVAGSSSLMLMLRRMNMVQATLSQECGLIYENGVLCEIEMSGQSAHWAVNNFSDVPFVGLTETATEK